MHDIVCEKIEDHRYATLIKGAVWGGGLLGIILFARKTRMFARYERVVDIPLDVYEKGIPLKGIVRSVHSNGYMKVEHIPTFMVPSVLSKKRFQPGLLDVRLAGLDVTSAGFEYLTRNLRLRSREIFFSAIKPTENKQCVDAEIYLQKKKFLQTNLNVDLVRRGFARVTSLTNVEHMDTLKTNASYSRLVSKLIMSEKIAERRGLGLWACDTWAETVFSYPAAFKQIVLSTAVLTVVVGKKLITEGSHLSKQAFRFTVALNRYLHIIVQQLVNAILELSRIMKKKINDLLTR